MLLCILLVLSGCSISRLLALSQQEWSDNYALMEGASATHPAMIDGNLKTAGAAAKWHQGETESIDPITGYSRIGTSHPKAEARVVLPQKRAISKVVLVSIQLNQSDFAGECNLFVPEKDDWKLIKTFVIKGITTEIRIPPIQTDKIRLRLPARFAKAGSSLQLGGVVNLYDVLTPEIQEIELYGPAIEGKKETTK